MRRKRVYEVCLNVFSTVCILELRVTHAKYSHERSLSYTHRQAPSSHLANLGSGAPSASVSSPARLTPATFLGSSSISRSVIMPSLQRTNAAGRVEEMSAQHASAVIATHAETRGRASPWKKTSPSCRCQSSAVRLCVSRRRLDSQPFVIDLTTVASAAYLQVLDVSCFQGAVTLTHTLTLENTRTSCSRSEASSLASVWRVPCHHAPPKSRPTLSSFLSNPSHCCHSLIAFQPGISPPFPSFYKTHSKERQNKTDGTVHARRERSDNVKRGSASSWAGKKK
jgi:hypothetical protein